MKVFFTTDGVALKKIFAVIVADFRLNYIVAGVTNIDPGVTEPVYKTNYKWVQHCCTVDNLEIVPLYFPPTGEQHRWAVVQQNFGAGTGTLSALCFAEVKVFVRGSLTYIIISHNFSVVFNGLWHENMDKDNELRLKNKDKDLRSKDKDKDL